jgi:hypothetical protein
MSFKINIQLANADERDREMIQIESVKQYATREEANAQADRYLHWAGEAERFDDIRMEITPGHDDQPVN